MACGSKTCKILRNSSGVHRSVIKSEKSGTSEKFGVSGHSQTFGIPMLSGKNGTIEKNRGCRGDPEEHVFRENGTSEKFGGIRTFPVIPGIRNWHKTLQNHRKSSERSTRICSWGLTWAVLAPRQPQDPFKNEKPDLGATRVRPLGLGGF